MVEELRPPMPKQPAVWIDPPAFRRFADQSFAPKINALLRGQGLSQHSKYFILLLIWHGRIAGCASEAFKIASDTDEEIEIRSLAIRAVGATADESILNSLGEYALKSNDLPRPLAGALFDALYPRVFDVDKLLSVINLVHGGDGRPSDAPTVSLTQS